MEEELLQLKTLFSQLGTVSESDWELFSGIWQPFSAGRKEILSEAGSTERYLYFVTEGVQRVVYNDENGHQATIVFTYAPSFGGVIDSFLLQIPSRYSYETLSRSRFLRTSYADLDQVVKACPAIERTMFYSTARVLSGVLQRLSELQCYSSEEKFRSLLKRSPHILQLVPHKYLADYIGIDPTNFSKFLKTISW